MKIATKFLFGLILLLLKKRIVTRSYRHDKEHWTLPMQALAQRLIISPIRARARIIQRCIAHTCSVLCLHSLSLERRCWQNTSPLLAFRVSSVVESGADDPRDTHAYRVDPEGEKGRAGTGSPVLRSSLYGARCVKRANGMPTCGRDVQRTTTKTSPGRTYVNRLAWGEPSGCCVAARYRHIMLFAHTHTRARESILRILCTLYTPLLVMPKCRTVLYESSTCDVAE